ncbi:MAG: Flagellar basal body-associated protein FliL [Desulfonauticus sp. 38_4375]|jgi:flagellar FliL protein|nr:MAG: Flagellar basal body-associated protein FliL [Desulfonauticus sp. 38_4375]
MAKKKDKKEEKSQEEPKKGGKLKLIIIIVLALGLLGGGGFFAYKYFLAPKPATEEAKPEASKEGEKKDTKEEVQEEGGPTEIYSLPAFIVNLADPLGRRYLKLSLDVEVKNQKVVEEVDKKLPQIKDAIILLLSSKSFNDIDSIEEKLALKNEIMSRLTQILGQDKVIRVYFTEMVVQ